ncbi:MAG: hypothetical protein PHS93_00865 [Candidatus Omnitrophica bacterium]|nr:hypothetical protein [Candidatus Omnitrophota bacterium]MDD5351704.1 hypothetical protein [Candidatus Omnitrophota bacterium]MDD5550914.1 hypothetical protein [Candidatus Omnitrophota bacterium]
MRRFNLFRRRPGFVLFFSLIIFIAACSQQDTNVSVKSQANAFSASIVLAKDFAPGQLEAHYLKHKDEFGNITQEEYLNNARALLNSSTGKNVLGKTRTNGDILRYRVKSGEFAVMAGDGRIRTYFKTNYKYWLRQ